MKRESVLATCYSILRRKTPLNTDCGKICDGKCCKGDEKLGMILFPGESNMLDPKIKIEKDEKGLEYAICNGSCDRNKRPLSCRIYPLFPVVCEDEAGNEYVKVVCDYRGDCPLCSGDYKFDKEFVKAVKRVGERLLLNDEIALVYRRVCEEVSDIYELADKLKKYVENA